MGALPRGYVTAHAARRGSQKVLENASKGSQKGLRKILLWVHSEKGFSQRKTKGVENSGEGKTYHKTPPPKRFWTPPPLIHFPPPCLFTQCHFPLRERAQTRQIPLSEPSKTGFGGHTLWYVSFPPPPTPKIARYVLPPPL